jgi:hypothetical protein
VVHLLDHAVQMRQLCTQFRGAIFNQVKILQYCCRIDALPGSQSGAEYCRWDIQTDRLYRYRFKLAFTMLCDRKM